MMMEPLAKVAKYDDAKRVGCDPPRTLKIDATKVQKLQKIARQCEEKFAGNGVADHSSSTDLKGKEATGGGKKLEQIIGKLASAEKGSHNVLTSDMNIVSSLDAKKDTGCQANFDIEKVIHEMLRKRLTIGKQLTVAFEASSVSKLIEENNVLKKKAKVLEGKLNQALALLKKVESSQSKAKTHEVSITQLRRETAGEIESRKHLSPSAVVPKTPSPNADNAAVRAVVPPPGLSPFLPPTQRPVRGTSPTQRPVPGTSPTQRLVPGTSPTQRPVPGTLPTQRPVPGTSPMYRHPSPPSTSAPMLRYPAAQRTADSIARYPKQQQQLLHGNPQHSLPNAPPQMTYNNPVRQQVPQVIHRRPPPNSVGPTPPPSYQTVTRLSDNVWQLSPQPPPGSFQQVGHPPPNPVNPYKPPHGQGAVRIQQANPMLMNRPPVVKLSISNSDSGIVLSWDLLSPSDDASVVDVYNLYACQGSELNGRATAQWKRIGVVKALPLPMACTLTQFVRGSSYHFVVATLDKSGVQGDLSNSCTMRLGNM